MGNEIAIDWSTFPARVPLFAAMIVSAFLSAPVRSESSDTPLTRPMDINTASLDDLKTLPGIDDYRAKMIDAYYCQL